MSADVIKLLPDSVANQIAAGEVIQRPASVIKELVENSIDAGADSVKIILKDAGRTLIQVVDNGRGMSDTDAALAFERHATSKISAASDLFALHTMGFRGEALASIAAIAQIDMRTMPRDEKIGTRILIEGSRVIEQTPEATAPGTNLMVKNLFFNVPARRKFLKKDTVELNNIVREFERLALVNTGVEFTLIHNDVTLQQLRKGSLKNRITDLFGKQLDRQLIEITTDTSIVKISGFIGLPENARKRNPLQYFFVNGRNMRHPYFQKAVLHCYEELIPADHQPNFFLNFEVDPATIDVNIHPTKSEIKFENEAPIWQILVAAIKEAMGKFNVVPSIDFDQTDAIDLPAFNPSDKHDFANLPDDSYNPFASPAPKPDGQPMQSGSHSFASGLNSRGSAINDWDKLYAGFESDADKGIDAAPAFDMPVDPAYSPFRDEAIANGTTIPEPSAAPFESRLNAMRAVPFDPTVDAKSPSLPEMSGTESAGFLQLKNRYIILPSHSGLLIIDRHRAHIKVLYEEFIKTGITPETQQVLFPETLTLSPSLNVVLESMLDTVAGFGFSLSYLGDNVWAINGIPASIGKLNPVEVLGSMIENVAEDTVLPETDLRHRLALSMAYATAINPTRQLTQAEAESLLSSFLSLPDPSYTPDGHPTFITVPYSELSRRLG